MSEQLLPYPINDLPQFAESKNEETAEAYLMDLGLMWKDLNGKEILDIGAGLGRFAQAAQTRGIKVTSVDMHPEWHTETGVTPTNVPYLVADARSRLPYGDDSFDLIVSRAAVHSMVDTRQDLGNILHEAKRLLKNGGEFRFGPGIIDVREMSETEQMKWEQYQKRYLAGDSFTKEEDKEAQVLSEKADVDDSVFAQEQQERESLSEDERLELRKQRSLAAMHTIEPNITMQSGNKVRDKYSSMYYLMKKEEPA